MVGVCLTTALTSRFVDAVKAVDDKVAVVGVGVAAAAAAAADDIAVVFVGLITSCALSGTLV